MLPVFNEASYLQAKLQNLLRINLPGRDIEIILVLDGCEDKSNEIAKSWHSHPRVTVLELPYRNGKPAAINAGVRAAQGQIIVFCDVRQQISSDALHHLLGHLGDPGIGLVAGCLVRAYGPLYAMRRKHFRPMPENLILDDMVLPVTIAAQGLRAVFEPRAKVHDPRQFTGTHQFCRTSRIVRGLIQITPFVLSTRISWRFKTMFLRHKIYRLLLLIGGMVGLTGLIFTQSFLAIWLMIGLVVGFLFAASFRFWIIQLFATGFSLFAWPFRKADVLWKK